MDTEAFLSLLRETGQRSSTTLPAELRKHTDCDQMRIEASFMAAKSVPSMVLVHAVDLVQRGAEAHTGTVVKYSHSKYALAETDHLQMATAQYYRHYEGNAQGVRDENEATYQESLLGYLAKWNPEVRGLLDPWRGSASGSVTYRVDEQWIFCTSSSPQSRSEQVRMCEEFEADCATWLGEPSEFARELGSAFAQMVPAPPVLREEWFHQIQDSMMRTRSSFDRVVHVRHGPVVYTDDAESLIESVPLQLRSAVVPFVKSTEYAYQREYRFTISTIGTPAQRTLLVPVTPELRALSGHQEHLGP